MFCGLLGIPSDSAFSGPALVKIAYQLCLTTRVIGYRKLNPHRNLALRRRVVHPERGTIIVDRSGGI
jgi:hypothetical protein